MYFGLPKVLNHVHKFVAFKINLMFSELPSKVPYRKKKKSVKNGDIFCQWQIFLPTIIFYRQLFLPMINF